MPKVTLDHSQCQYSSGLDDSITAGQGQLDHNGYWEIPCEQCREEAQTRWDAEQKKQHEVKQTQTKLDFHDAQSLLGMLERWHNLKYLLRCLSNDCAITLHLHEKKAGIGGEAKIDHCKSFASKMLRAELDVVVAGIKGISGLDVE